MAVVPFGSLQLQGFGHDNLVVLGDELNCLIRMTEIRQFIQTQVCPSTVVVAVDPLVVPVQCSGNLEGNLEGDLLR